MIKNWPYFLFLLILSEITLVIQAVGGNVPSKRITAMRTRPRTLGKHKCETLVSSAKSSCTENNLAVLW
jgi:hypothetical protein